ncbi:nuclear transport factor 2 family protein [Variovorax sp. WS11]|uniref:nuclear transport factor 2 family protein n=1 Tax=Variovorax sp. WS11 TaxID=1105204 RepID=UPI0013DC245C|nr:nuclear transport factor 2 family protein [Variovorax sp. WS11]NDZ17331.1 nuclear transport factor 2 family protein [Variovorax sp. WS11]
MPHRDDIPALLLELQARRHRAMVEADLETLDVLLDDTLSYTHSDASRDSKNSYLAKVRGGAMRYAEVSSGEEEVLVLSDAAACVLGRMQLAGAIAGAPRRFDNRFLAVWVRRGAQWKLAAFQPTPVTSTTGSR